MLLRMQPPSGPLDEIAFPAVLAAAQVGEQWAAEALFRDVQPRVLRFLRSSEPRAADDIAGDVWMAVARGLAGFEGGLADLRAWVFTIARRRLADHRRTAARRSTTPSDSGAFGGIADATDLAATVVERLSGQEAVDLLMALLPAEQAEVLLLRVVGELDVGHVAEVMGRPANWVRVNQHRALKRLAEQMGERTHESFRPAVIPQPAPTICTS